MLLCERCDEWYHYDCIGISNEEAAAEVDWDCGYCRSPPDADGYRAWSLAVPQGNRKRPKIAPPRSDATTPKARGIQPLGDDLVYEGPKTWADCQALAREGGRKINLAEAQYKKKAMRIVKEGGHHIIDEMSLGGVQARGVDSALVDDLVGHGLLELDDDQDAKLQEDGDDV
jgi:hypothetical protein